ESSYSREEVEGIIAELEPVMAHVIAVQVRRSRYWLLKFLEKRIGQKEEAIVLGRSRTGYQALIPEYMMECRVSVPASYELKPEDVIRITIQHVDARNDAFNVFMS
ncbi:MAG: exoribonuclease II, partial [Deltaproteobacteria bacterium]|nr:exoribonuclease II [Deltaproteobacteria bacterium]